MDWFHDLLAQHKFSVLLAKASYTSSTCPLFHAHQPTEILHARYGGGLGYTQPNRCPCHIRVRPCQHHIHARIGRGSSAAQIWRCLRHIANGQSSHGAKSTALWQCVTVVSTAWPPFVGQTHENKWRWVTSLKATRLTSLTFRIAFRTKYPYSVQLIYTPFTSSLVLRQLPKLDSPQNKERKAEHHGSQSNRACLVSISRAGQPRHQHIQKHVSIHSTVLPQLKPNRTRTIFPTPLLLIWLVARMPSLLKFTKSIGINLSN
ncbi:hypothetical protein L7F22_037490 [Adiantum nelumboides]|nr:hypothetical protein [Adiantum nelumboides]